MYWNKLYAKDWPYFFIFVEYLLSCIFSPQDKCFHWFKWLYLICFGFRTCWTIFFFGGGGSNSGRIYNLCFWFNKPLTNDWRVRALRALEVSCSRSQFPPYSHVNEPSDIPRTCPLGAALRSPVSLQALLAAGIARPSVPLTSCNGSLNHSPTYSPVASGSGWVKLPTTWPPSVTTQTVWTEVITAVGSNLKER